MRMEKIEHTIEMNIFSFKKIDGAAYFIFYIVLPIIITSISLYAFPSDMAPGIYCYVTILISALNCCYDAGNRWLPGKKSKRNTKLFVVVLFLSVVVLYCLTVILGTLIANGGWLRICDWILLAYIVANVIAVIDVVQCFTLDMAWKTCVSNRNSEEERK